MPKKPEIPERMKVPEKELYSRAEQNKPQKRFECPIFADCVIFKHIHPLLLAHYSACLLLRPLSHWGGPSPLNGLFFYSAESKDGLTSIHFSFFLLSPILFLSHAGKENKCARTRDVTRGDKYSKEISMEGVVTHRKTHDTECICDNSALSSQAKTHALNCMFKSQNIHYTVLAT